MGLVAEGLRAGYGAGRGAGAAPVLDGVSAVVERGRITALLGPNGSGKSTLVRCLARAHKPLAGRVSVDGRDLYSEFSAREAARLVSYVGQENPMPFAFTVDELVRIGADAGGAAKARERVAAAVGAMELERLRTRSVVALSGGERQRASIARALAQGADFLLLDEPTAHLDLRHQAALMTAARDAARQGRGVLLVLHDPNLAAANADQVLLMRDGRVAATGSPAVALTAENLAAVYQTPLRLAPGDAEGRAPLILPVTAAGDDDNG